MTQPPGPSYPPPTAVPQNSPKQAPAPSPNPPATVPSNPPQPAPSYPTTTPIPTPILPKPAPSNPTAPKSTRPNTTQVAPKLPPPKPLPTTPPAPAVSAPPTTVVSPATLPSKQPKPVSRSPSPAPKPPFQVSNITKPPTLNAPANASSGVRATRGGRRVAATTAGVASSLGGRRKSANLVSRQVFHLTGEQTPASVVPFVPVGVRGRLNRKRAWAWKEFRNSAREDGLRLSHWGRMGGQDDDYTFARFNKKIRMIEYTDKEYTEVIEGLKPLNVVRSDNGEGEEGGKGEGGRQAGDVNYVRPQREWTRKETDMVFRLAQEFDMRFVVVADRWPDGWPARGIDEIKDRYYSVAKALIEKRGWMEDEEQMSKLPVGLQRHCHSIMMNPFDYEYESIRKNQLHVQYHRSKTEMREEEETVREARRIEQSRKRSAKERTRLAKLLTPAGDIVGGRAKGVDPSRAVAAASQPHKTFPHRKVASGAYARSGMIYTPVTNSAKLSRRIDEALVELGVGLRPTPTSIVVDNFDLLRMEIMHYIELQRTVMRKEEEVHLLRVKLAKLKGMPAPLPPQGVTLSHKKRRADDIETGSLFGGPPPKQPKVLR